ncbi:MAG: GtrA family protein [Bacteroidetes bacterium]|nr:GtrA family protein [Bacteroidota bacterium]
MNRLLEKIAIGICRIVDLFHPLFQRLLPLQTFRYLVAGGANTFLGLLVYFLCYQYLFKETIIDLWFYAFKAHSASLLVSFLFTFPIGFFFARYVVFDNSNLKARIQLFRYLMICLFNLFLNYLLLKILVEILYWHALLAQFTTVILVIAFSYVAQRNFSFKVSENQTNC